MASKPTTTQKEVSFASSVLKYLGVKDPAANLYLILAIVAWVRSESGKTYLGNNPLNIRNSPFASGYRQTRNHNGHFAIFANLDVAAKASASFLMKNKGVGYEPIIAAAKRTGGTEEQKVNQARDFLTAIAMSKWSSDHYGAADGNVTTNKLIAVWASLTGHPIPREWLVTTKPTPPSPKPKPPVQPPGNAFIGSGVRHEYVDPYAARNFYEARKHSGDFLLPADPVL